MWGYVTILVISYGENIVPPIPGDMIVVLGGYLAGLGHLNLGVVMALSVVGGSVGFMTVYAVGRQISAQAGTVRSHRWMPREQILQAREWIHAYGHGVVVANRFLFGARSVISITVGMAQMSAWKTAIGATVSALAWSVIITYAGYAVGENWPIIADYLQAYGWIVMGVLAALLVGWGLRHLWKRWRSVA